MLALKDVEKFNLGRIGMSDITISHLKKSHYENMGPATSAVGPRARTDS